MEKILARITVLFEKEKLFTDPNLKLATLAKKTDVSQHVLSQVINKGLQKSFSDLLNHYRIEEVKTRMANPRYANLSIMGIAYDAGYSSKATFHAAFKKHTGLTPGEYLKKVK